MIPENRMRETLSSISFSASSLDAGVTSLYMIKEVS